MDWRMANGILCYARNDNKAVYIMSTIHSPNDESNPPAIVKRRKKKRPRRNAPEDTEEVPCPTLVVAYNKHMRGVDANDQFRKYII